MLNPEAATRSAAKLCQWCLEQSAHVAPSQASCQSGELPVGLICILVKGFPVNCVDGTHVMDLKPTHNNTFMCIKALARPKMQASSVHNVMPHTHYQEYCLSSAAAVGERTACHNSEHSLDIIHSCTYARNKCTRASSARLGEPCIR